MRTARADHLGVFGPGLEHAWEKPLRDAKAPWVFARPFPEFRRLEALGRFVCLAVEALDMEFPQGTALVFASTFGCLHADRLFEASRHGVIRPALFPYTLPSTCLAELAIRHRVMGPTLCLSVAPGDDRTALAEARRLLAAGEAEAAVVLVGDVVPPDQVSMTAHYLTP